MTNVLRKRTSSSVFQVLLLDNDNSDNIEVQEAKQVDFFHIKEHLKNGGSVFITSKNSQKIEYPKFRAQQNYNNSRKNYSSIFLKCLRKS